MADALDSKSGGTWFRVGSTPTTGNSITIYIFKYRHMEVYSNIINSFTPSVITIGMFDGVHEGHKVLLNAARETSLKENLPFLVMTFKDHPDLINKSCQAPKLLTTIDEKLSLLEKLGVDKCMVIDFSDNFASLGYSDFIQKVLIDSLKIRHIFVGYDFRFGYKAQGNGEILRNYGDKMNFHTYMIDAVKNGDYIISSSLIRSLFQDGNISLANKLLGYNYSLNTEIINKNLNQDTAIFELVTNERKFIPLKGLYSCKTKINGIEYLGILSIEYDYIELHIISFNSFANDKYIEIQFINYLGQSPNLDIADYLITSDLHRKLNSPDI